MSAMVCFIVRYLVCRLLTSHLVERSFALSVLSVIGGIRRRC